MWETNLIEQGQWIKLIALGLNGIKIIDSFDQPNKKI